LASRAFFQEDVNRVALLHQAFYSSERHAAVHMLQYLTIEELEQLFDDLVYLSTMERFAGFVRSLILKLPREWVVSHIEPVAERVLQAKSDYMDYRCLLDLYLELDRGLALKLATQAARHADPDIKEVDEEYLNQIDGIPDSSHS
jgi:hypothetical protein